MLSVIAVEDTADHFIGTLFRRLSNDRTGAVTAAVIDQNKLKFFTGRVKSFQCTVDQFLQTTLFVVNGDND